MGQINETLKNRWQDNSRYISLSINLVLDDKNILEIPSTELKELREKATIAEAEYVKAFNDIASEGENKYNFEALSDFFNEALEITNAVGRFRYKLIAKKMAEGKAEWRAKHEVEEMVKNFELTIKLKDLEENFVSNSSQQTKDHVQPLFPAQPLTKLKDVRINDKMDGFIVSFKDHNKPEDISFESEIENVEKFLAVYDDSYLYSDRESYHVLDEYISILKDYNSNPSKINTESLISKFWERAAILKINSDDYNLESQQVENNSFATDVHYSDDEVPTITAGEFATKESEMESMNDSKSHSGNPNEVFAGITKSFDGHPSMLDYAKRFCGAAILLGNKGANIEASSSSPNKPKI